MTTNYISEDYCSEEIASLLEENGYVGATNTCLDKEGLRVKEITLQSAMKWLREVYKLHIWIAHKLKQNKGLPWYYEIHNIETGDVVKIGDVVCGSYEVACEAAIKYTLENLI